MQGSVASSGVAAATALILGVVSVGTASAEDSPVEEIAVLISQVAPDAGPLAETSFTADHVIAEADGAKIEVPLVADESLTLTKDGSTIEVTLPAEITTDRGHVANDGTIVYPSEDDSASSAVQVFEDGAVRIQTVLFDSGAPHEFTYKFGDLVPVLREDGGADLIDRTAVGVEAAVGSVDSPWALDADGHPVQTRYEVVDGTLVQVVEADESTAYPIVADPTLSFGTGAYITFNRSETKAIAGKTQYAVVAASVCAKVNGWTAVFCGALISSRMIQLDSAFKNAANSNKCLQMKWQYWTIGTWPSKMTSISC